MTFINYLKFSNLKLSLDLSPFTWGVQFLHQAPTAFDPKLHIYYIRLLPLSLIIVIDDGTWVPETEISHDELDTGYNEASRRGSKATGPR